MGGLTFFPVLPFFLHAPPTKTSRHAKGRPEVGFGLARSRNKPRESISKCHSTRDGPLIDPWWLGDSAAFPHVAAFPMAPAVAKSLVYSGKRQQQRRQIKGRGRAGRPWAARPRPRRRTGTRARLSAPTRRSRDRRALRGPRPSTATAVRSQGRVLGFRPNRPARRSHGPGEHQRLSKGACEDQNLNRRRATSSLCFRLRIFSPDRGLDRPLWLQKPPSNKSKNSAEI